MTDVRMKWETNPREGGEDEHRILHLDYQLPTRSVRDMVRSLVGSDDLLESCPEMERLDEIMNGIHGVAGFKSNGYDIVIQKGGVFSWDEITPRVEQALMEFVGADNVVCLTSD